jgi:hypothetical protein
MAQRLIQRRFVPADAVVDFGPVPPFPPGELAQAAITELERALSTPHKSLLKLKLMEAYAEAPQLGSVSSVYKSRLHAGETDALRLDPYLLLYEHVEHHLQSAGREDELAFARALLIGKTAESIPWQQQPELPSGQARSLLERFLRWGFDAADVARFRNLESWTMRERLVEHDQIMRALERGVSLVQSLVDRAESATDTDLAKDTTAGHKLHRLSDTRLHQLSLAVSHMRPEDQHGIEELHPALITRRRPLTLQLVRDRNHWVIREGEALVACCRRLVEAVIWAELNGAGLVPATPEAAASHTVAQVLQGFRGAQRSIYVFVNAEARHQRMPPQVTGDTTDGGGATLLSLRNDPLDYGGFHQLHLETFDLVSRDASGRWRLESLVDDAALLEGLGRLLASPPATVSWQVLGGQERFQLAHRLEQLHTLAQRVLDGPGALFVLPFGADMVTLKRLGAAVETRRHRSLAELQAYVQSTGCTTLGVDPVSQRLKALLRAS